ncbi:hypothetical protein D6774_02435 [Candidatus Woesearchaeota archaeon]|nr:MAG: hypothetical protein D6774_02435 [Candidatus Woesearchaeota archaeon]
MKKIIISGIALVVFVVVALALFFSPSQTIPQEPLSIPVVWFYQQGEVSAGGYLLGETIQAHAIIENYALQKDKAQVSITLRITTPQGEEVPDTLKTIQLTNADGNPQEFFYTLNSLVLQPGAYLLNITATDKLLNETTSKAVPLFIDEPNQLTLIGPFAGRFNEEITQFNQLPLSYKAGDLIDFYYEVRGMGDPLNPHVRVTLLVVNETGDIVDITPLAVFNESYAEPVTTLQQTITYNTSVLTPGTYYFHFTAQDEAQQDRKTVKVVLQ